MTERFTPGIGVDTGPVRLGPVHLIGIGGAGMSAVARLLLAAGVTVSGSDAQESAAVTALRAAGARVEIGQRPENLGQAQTVVISTAIRESNPELAAARERGLSVIHRSQALAVAMHGRRVIAVAGTHGKTTTSSMTAVALQQAGADPSWAIGAAVPDLGGNAGAGRGEWFVAEADESDGSFLAYRPEIAVVMNIEPDHLDHYGSEEAFVAAFRDFARTIRPGGALVVCQDDDGSRALGRWAREQGIRVRTYGRDSGADVIVQEIRSEGLGATAELVAGEGADERRHHLRLAVPGEHNVLNATGALCAAVLSGTAPEDAARGLAQFHGSARRFDVKGEAGGVHVVDDYAHHPTEVRAALTAARRVAGEHRVLVLFQPHLFSRTQAFAREFAQALELADQAWVLPIFQAREDPIPGVTSELISDQAGQQVRAAEAEQAMEQAVAAAGPGDLLMTVGAGDVTRLGPELLSALTERAGSR